ncbi:Conserved oligomeric Golgi complex component 8 [Actinacidiphila bryophytorum]|uniref:Conserved oligomeric Golgi complex component 8 n=1 Tax=Actinacidiphila bryophytorum TaxID=1436133 RepID=A0A9W4E6C6_9ACTN|nr:Conserved oligomeric Golgi complex component 8 [Actinacidiphila bryophytorum]
MGVRLPPVGACRAVPRAPEKRSPSQAAAPPAGAGSAGRGHPQGRGELRAQSQRAERYERAASGNHQEALGVPPGEALGAELRDKPTTAGGPGAAGSRRGGGARTSGGCG